MAELQSPQLRLSVQPRTFLIVRLHFSSIVSLLNPLRQVQVVRAHDAERSVRSAWIYVGARHGVGDRQRQVPVSPRLDRGWSSVHSLVAAPLSDPGLLVVGRREYSWNERSISQFMTEKKFPGDILARTYSTPSSPAREHIQF
jgi:hypothetical protein